MADYPRLDPNGLLYYSQQIKQKIEDAVVGTYQNIEDAVVGTYQKIEDKFVEKFLEEGDETDK